MQSEKIYLEQICKTAVLFIPLGYFAAEPS